MNLPWKTPQEQAREMREYFLESIASVSTDELYDRAEPSWPGARERFPDRESVSMALYSISRLK
jgi:hypothetical protein